MTWIRALPLLGLVACGGGSAIAPPPPVSNAPGDGAPASTPEPPRAPEVIERVVDDSDQVSPQDCTAQRPEAGIIDPTSSEIARLEILVHTQHIVEKVEMRSGQKVEISVGGCVHYGHYFSVQLDGDRPATDVEHYLFRALSVFDALPYRDITETALGDIRDLISRSSTDPRAMADCNFPDGQGYASAGCKIDAVGPEVKVSVWYDIAL